MGLEFGVWVLGFKPFRTIRGGLGVLGLRYEALGLNEEEGLGS
jgi:hypothetical protein